MIGSAYEIGLRNALERPATEEGWAASLRKPGSVLEPVLKGDGSEAVRVRMLLMPARVGIHVLKTVWDILFADHHPPPSPGWLSVRDAEGRTPLLEAAEWGCESVFGELFAQLLEAPDSAALLRTQVPALLFPACSLREARQVFFPDSEFMGVLCRIRTGSCRIAFAVVTHCDLDLLVRMTDDRGFSVPMAAAESGLTPVLHLLHTRLDTEWATCALQTVHVAAADGPGWASLLSVVCSMGNECAVAWVLDQDLKWTKESLYTALLAIATPRCSSSASLGGLCMTQSGRLHFMNLVMTRLEACRDEEGEEHRGDVLLGSVLGSVMTAVVRWADDSASVEVCDRLVALGAQAMHVGLDSFLWAALQARNLGALSFWFSGPCGRSTCPKVHMTSLKTGRCIEDWGPPSCLRLLERCDPDVVDEVRHLPICLALATLDTEVLRLVLRDCMSHGVPADTKIVLAWAAWLAASDVHPPALKQLDLLVRQVGDAEQVVFVDVFVWLIAQYSSTEDSVLAKAATQGACSVVRRLLQAGADPFGLCFDLRRSFELWTCVEAAVQTGRPEVVHEFLVSEACRTRLTKDMVDTFWGCVCLACTMGATAVLEELLLCVFPGPEFGLGSESWEFNVAKAMAVARNHGSVGCVDKMVATWSALLPEDWSKPAAAVPVVTVPVVTIASPTAEDLAGQPLPLLQRELSGKMSRDRLRRVYLTPALKYSLKVCSLPQSDLLQRVLDMLAGARVAACSGLSLQVTVYADCEEFAGVLVALLNECTDGLYGRDVLVAIANCELRQFCYSENSPIVFGRISCPSFQVRLAVPVPVQPLHDEDHLVCDFAATSKCGHALAQSLTAVLRSHWPNSGDGVRVMYQPASKDMRKSSFRLFCSKTICNPEIWDHCVALLKHLLPGVCRLQFATCNALA